ncbi:flagellin [Marinobacter antarcticus]|uniref:Flagellin n=1 Tax=Marinobacter antarcticus TaxID=564117 RepID=A0A1M6RXS7_9GAMM|nr:flagellin [Marinobacter antarcticus]SHK37273.1 flagellin [Marinobacter antarcticus]
MALGINTNVASLSAQNQLSNSQKLNDQALERLSSGLRINSAKDDAAGLAISTRFSAQISGLDVAQRNANDGISYAQTAEGALGEVTNGLSRIRDLAVQSANDTNSASDRQALNQEVSALISEVNRISSSTQFNGQNILDGSLSTLNFQVGANAGQTISVDGVDARGSQLGAEVFEGASFDRADIAGFSGAGSLTLNGIDVDLSSAQDGSDVVSAINGVTASTGVSAAQATETVVAGGAYNAPSGATATVNINGTDVTIADAADIDAATKAINDAAGQTGVAATNDGTNITLTDSNGASISVTDDGTTDIFGDIGTSEEIYDAGLVLNTEIDSDITVGGTGTVANFGLTTGNLATNASVLNDVNVLSRTDATDAIKTVDFALDQINSLRAELGAVQSRFESTISNLASTSENLSAANSRILDADFAAETAKLAKSQVLQQAGISVLAQANARPQQVLSLLQ